MDMKQTSRRFHWRSDRRKAGILAGLALALVLGLAACYPGGPETLGDIGVVVTFKNPEGNFSGMMTYAMEDTVVALVDPDDSSSTPIEPRFNSAILEEIHTQMDNAGFTRIDDPDTAAPTNPMSGSVSARSKAKPGSTGTAGPTTATPAGAGITRPMSAGPPSAGHGRLGDA